MNILYIFLQETPGGGFAQIGFLVLLFGVMYFFMIRPQQKRQKEQKRFIEEIKKGDEVVTHGGVIGRILELNDTVVTLEVDRGVRMRVDRNYISLESTKTLKEKE